MAAPPLPLAYPYPPSPSHTATSTSSWTQAETTSATSHLWTQSAPSHSTGRSDSLSSLASSASFPHSPPIQVNLPSSVKAEAFDFGAIGQTKRVRQFGEGWKSTLTDAARIGNGLEVHVDDTPHTPPMTASFLDDPSNITPIAPTRLRNPSLPILPSQGILRNTLGLNHMPDFDSLTLSDQHLYPPTPSKTLNHGFFSPHHHVQAQGHVDPRYIPKLVPKTPSLTHHQSVPNLERAPRRRGSVRFSDELLAYDHDEALSPRPRMGQRSLSTPAAETKRRNVYIHSLPPQITEHALRSCAEVFGKVLSMRVAVDEGKGVFDRYENRRHAFVMFETNDQAGGFMGAMRAKGLPCEYAKEDWQTEYKLREDRTSSNIYVVGLPLEWGKDEVEDYMTQFGRVASLRLLEDKEGNRRGPVLVRFDSRPQAERAINILNGQTHPTTGERIQARIADSDGQKDYKKLRTSTSADLLLDDRNVPVLEDTDDVEYLRQMRDKYARRLQLLNAQITAAAELSTPPPPSHAYAQHYPSPRTQGPYDLPTPPNSGSAFSTPPYSAGTPPQWRHRQLSSSHTPWMDGSPHHHHHSSPHPSYPAVPEFTFAPYAFGAQAEHQEVVGSTGQRQSFSFRPPPTQFEAGLHHARSTPDLGRASSAKLLWPS